MKSSVGDGNVLKVEKNVRIGINYLKDMLLLQRKTAKKIEKKQNKEL